MKQAIWSQAWLWPGWGRLGSIEATCGEPGPMSLYGGGSRPEQVGKPRDLAVGHLLSHVEQEPTVGFLNTTHQPAELVQKTSLFPVAAPNDIVSALALRKIGEFGRFFSVIEELIKRDFQSAGHLFQSFNGRNGMAVFYAGNVAA
jgi:hypothetical protein